MLRGETATERSSRHGGALDWVVVSPQSRKSADSMTGLPPGRETFYENAVRVGAHTIRGKNWPRQELDPGWSKSTAKANGSRATRWAAPPRAKKGGSGHA